MIETDLRTTKGERFQRPGSGPGIRRLERNARLILLIMAAGALILRGWELALSVGLGGILALVSFYCKGSAVNRALSPSPGGGSGLVIVAFLAGLVLIFLGLFAMIRLSFLSLYGALGGLSIFVIAGFLEAILLLVRR